MIPASLHQMKSSAKVGEDMRSATLAELILFMVGVAVPSEESTLSSLATRLAFLRELPASSFSYALEQPWQQR